jgi:hypothetical protein
VPDIEWKKRASNGAGAAVIGPQTPISKRKERSKLWVYGSLGSGRNHPGMADGNGFDFAITAPDRKRFSIQLEVKSAGISGLNEDVVVGEKGALVARLQELRTRKFAVYGDRDPALFTRVNEDEKLTGARGADGGALRGGGG